MNKTKLILAMAALLLCGQASADDARQYHIPAQSLNNALLKFSADSGVETLYAVDKMRGLNSNALEGSMTPAQALSQLLQGSGMTYRFVDARTVTVEQAPTSNNTEPQSGGDTTLPKVTVEADAGKPYDDPNWANDPYNPDYNRPNASTGTKTDTPLMETPVSIQVVPRAVLDDQQAIKLDQALKNVSGVNSTQGSGGLSDLFVLRGFSSVIQFRNGFRFNTRGGSVGTRQMANVERIEVLKGPSAVLYGQGDPGGMINVVTKQPLATPYYSLQQQFGSFDLYRTSVDTTGPLTKDDTLLYRFNASFEDSGSFREFVDSERIFLAPIVKWNISPRTQATLEMEYRHDNLVYDPHAWPFVNGRFIDMPRSRNLTERTPNTIEDIFIGFNWSHQFNDDWTVNHQFAADRLDQKEFLFIFSDNSTLTNGTQRDRTLGNFPAERNSYYTDLNLTGHFDTLGLKHTLLLGGDYYRWDQINKNHDEVTLPLIDAFNPVHSGLTALPQLTGTGHDLTDFYGVYAQDQIKLPYGLQVMGGLRYQSIHRTFVAKSLTGTVNSQSAYSASAVTPRVGLLWQAQDWLSLYGNYVENFGANNTAIAFDGNALPPESSQGWETGIKTEFFDGRLSASLTYFDLTKQNVATRDPDPSHVCAGGFCSVATGEARSRGPELDIRGEILPGWNAIATYAYLDTRVTRDNNPARLGNRLPFAPRNLGSLWTTYDFQGGALNGFKIGGGVTMRDGTTDGTNNGFETAGYATVDLLAAYSLKVAGSKITAQLNVNNLLDKDYLTAAQFNGAATRTSIGTPRSFMGSIRLEF